MQDLHNSTAGARATGSFGCRPIQDWLRLRTRLRRCLLVASIGVTMSSGVLAAGEASGTSGGSCRANEAGPALRVHVEGLKDRTGIVRLELYPDRTGDFLADEARLLK